jgi:hypothetical protein
MAYIHIREEDKWLPFEGGINWDFSVPLRVF